MIRVSKLVLTLILVLFAATNIAAQQKLSNKDLKKLRNRMVGTFNSHVQSVADTSYFDITLNMTPIWKNNKVGYWLYVEQAMTTALQKPYRQRVYHLYKQDDSTLVSKVFEIKSAAKFINAQKNVETLNLLSMDSLVDRQGCSIYLKKNSDKNYFGSTPGKECLSSLRGATYATSEVVIYGDKLISWDRGWSKVDKQVWGAVKGGYEFVKQ